MKRSDTNRSPEPLRSRSHSSQSAPAEFRSDVPEDAVEHVGVVVHIQLVRDREEHGIGHPESLIGRESFDQHVGFSGVGAAEDGARVRVVTSN